MKISAKQYARGLQEATEGKSDVEVSEIIAKFLLILVKRGKVKLAPKIIKELEILGRVERGEILAELISARELSVESKERLASYIKKQSGQDKVVWQETIDKTLIGGGVIKFQDRIMDFSLRRALTQIKQALIK